MKYYGVVGKTPGGKSFRGVVATRGANETIAYGPAVFSAKPWHKRPLTIAELKRFARVVAYPRPRLSAAIKSHLEHKFAKETNPKTMAIRGKLLYFVQEVQRKLKEVS